VLKYKTRVTIRSIICEEKKTINSKDLAIAKERCIFMGIQRGNAMGLAAAAFASLNQDIDIDQNEINYPMGED
jgi:hypothetical protein